MLVWISGQSGAGKTTLGQSLHQRLVGWTHFDGDVFGHGGDPVTESGIASESMLQRRTPEMKAAWSRMETEGFGRLFRGEDAPLEYWQPFHEMLCVGVAKAWQQCAPNHMVVTFSVYSLLVRDYIRSQLPEVKFVVLNDVLGAATERKVQQVAASAKAEGKSLAEFLTKFSPEWATRSEEEALAHLYKYCGSVQRGLDPFSASRGEFGIDITASMSADSVYARARMLLLPCVGKTARLCIRELHEELDAPFVQHLITSPEWTRWIGDRGQDGTLYIRTNAARARRMYLLALRFTGEPIGLCGLLQRPYLTHPDVGYALEQSHVGHGYVSEGVQWFLEKRQGPIMGITLKDNVRSVSVLQRNGFKHVGFSKEAQAELYQLGE